MTIRAKLLGGFGIMVLLSLVLTTAAVVEIQRLDTQLRFTAQVERGPIEVIRVLQERVNDAYVSMLSLGILTEQDELDEEVAYHAELIQQYDKLFEQMTGLVASSSSPSQVRDGIRAVSEAKHEADMLVQTLLPKLQRAGDRSLLGNSALNSVRTSHDGWQAALRKLSEALARHNQLTIEAAQRTADQARTWLIGIGTAATLVGLLAARLILGSVLTPLRDAIRAARAVSQGDLSNRHTAPPRHDELGALLQALDTMRGGLHALIERVQLSSRHIVDASQVLSDGNRELNHRTEQTVRHLRAATSSVEHIAGNVELVRTATAQTDRLAKGTADIAEQGARAMRDVTSVMDGIHEASHRIAEIMGVMDNIAVQTHLLALNAAVEAAQAGEQGRGFAVVATEVRNLSQRSAAAAVEVRQLIEASNQRIASGVSTVHRAGACMDAITQAIEELNAMTARISAAVAEQSTSLESVGHTVTRIDAMTQENASLVVQIAGSSADLTGQAQELAASVGVFRLAPPPA